MSNELPGNATAPDEIPIIIVLKRRFAVGAKRLARLQGIGLDEFFENLIIPLLEAEAEELRRQMHLEETLLQAEQAIFAAEMEMDPRKIFPPTDH